nr:hypothetical protein [Salinigranum rubrum]
MPSVVATMANSGESVAARRTEAMLAIAMFTMLFPTRIVTRRRWGSSRRRWSTTARGSTSSSVSKRAESWWRSSEKMAISLPEKKALTPSRTTMTTAPRTTVRGVMTLSFAVCAGNAARVIRLAARVSEVIVNRPAIAAGTTPVIGRSPDQVVGAVGGAGASRGAE